MDFASMNKTALRNACKEARISYGGMSNDAMREALQARADAAAQAAVDAETAVLVRNEELAAMGKLGAGDDHVGAICPHCAIDHISNGLVTRDDEAANKPGVTLHMEGMNAKFECMGCGGQWGDIVAPYTKPAKQNSRATGTGLKIEKTRVERNGIKQPSIGGACRSVWDACTEMQALDISKPLTVKQVKAHAATMGWNENNAVIEFYRWRKWSAPTADETFTAVVTQDIPEVQAPA